MFACHSCSWTRFSFKCQWKVCLMLLRLHVGPCCHIGCKQRPRSNAIDRKQQYGAEACLSVSSTGERKSISIKKTNYKKEEVTEQNGNGAAAFITFHHAWWHPVTWGSDDVFITLEIMAAALMSGCDFMSTEVIHTLTHIHTLTVSLVLSWAAFFRIRSLLLLRELTAGCPVHFLQLYWFCNAWGTIGIKLFC